jgi:hypothetical protein
MGPARCRARSRSGPHGSDAGSTPAAEASAGRASGFTVDLWEEGRAHPTWGHHGGLSHAEQPELSSNSGGASAQGSILPRLTRSLPPVSRGLEIILTEIGGCRPPPRGEGPRNHPHRDRGVPTPPRLEGPRNHPQRDRGVPTHSVGRGRRNRPHRNGGCRPPPLVGEGPERRRPKSRRSLPPSMRSTAAAHSSPLEIVLARIGCRRRGCFDHSARRRGPQRMRLALDIY